jgi:hypothetical protein
MDQLVHLSQLLIVMLVDFSNVLGDKKFSIFVDLVDIFVLPNHSFYFFGNS